MAGVVRRGLRAIRKRIPSYTYFKDGKRIVVPSHMRTYYVKLKGRLKTVNKRKAGAAAIGLTTGAVGYKIARSEGAPRKDSIVAFLMTAPIGAVLSRELLKDLRKPTKEDVKRVLTEGGELAIILAGSYLEHRRQTRRRLSYVVWKTRARFGELTAQFVSDFFSDAPSKIVKYAYAIFRDGDVDDIIFDKNYGRLIFVREGRNKITRYIFENAGGGEWKFTIQSEEAEVI